MVHKFFHSQINDIKAFELFVRQHAQANKVNVLSFQESPKDDAGLSHIEFELDGENQNVEKVAHQIAEHYKETEAGK